MPHTQHHCEGQDDQVSAPRASLPRILCFHGGGSNARIFRAQCRAFVAALRPYFRFVFVDAPFLSQAGPCVLSAYNDWGPFRRWLRWTSDHGEVDPQDATDAMDAKICEAMEWDDAIGGTGQWVGVLGFSQGSKIAASLLYRQQMRVPEEDYRCVAGGGWPCSAAGFRFGILLAGRGPLVALDLDGQEDRLSGLPSMADMSMVTEAAGQSDTGTGRHVLRIPTIHVHGTRDPGIHYHESFMRRYCTEESTKLMVWDGDHRVPLKTKDIRPIVDEILNIAVSTGALEKHAMLRYINENN